MTWSGRDDSQDPNYTGSRYEFYVSPSCKVLPGNLDMHYSARFHTNYRGGRKSLKKLYIEELFL